MEQNTQKSGGLLKIILKLVPVNECRLGYIKSRFMPQYSKKEFLKQARVYLSGPMDFIASRE